MDLLFNCASAFEKLLHYQYCFTLGRKGKTTVITLGFSETDFHHLIGLHKLKDLQISRKNRQKVFSEILAGQVTYNMLTRSDYLDKALCRMKIFPKLESLLDGDQLIFSYNEKLFPYSAVQCDFLLKMGDGLVLDIAFLFIDKAEQDIYFCRSFFPMEQTDYSRGQMQYTLLKKEKFDIHTGEVTIQYNRFTPKEQN